jgi:hypothetical protein
MSNEHSDLDQPISLPTIAEAFVRRIAPHVWRESVFLHPDPAHQVPMVEVYDAVRDLLMSEIPPHVAEALISQWDESAKT